ncbi:hypothetical protein [Acidianus brierleyi]|uniref:Uncharacterized protein n=1 Tax=Acidianus brierleyi TaxID=41673 RepID=A0A2U9ICD9_9CREN|nr:hypothetical protein [Acidianus brierleyi]AWR93660.1 hypothetical protein DFR85_02550 [Acidianus brierleyi]
MKIIVVRKKSNTDKLINEIENKELKEELEKYSNLDYNILMNLIILKVKEINDTLNDIKNILSKGIE